MLNTFVKKVLVVAMLSSIAMVSFAEDAPVFDVDNMQQPYDNPAEPEMLSQNSQAAPIEPSAPPAAVQPAAAPKQTQQELSEVSNLNTRMDTLQNELQTLRGQIEEVSHQMQQLQVQQRAMYNDLEKRVTTASAKKVTPPPADEEQVTVLEKPSKSKKVVTTAKNVDVSSDSQPNVAEEQQTYQTAYNLIKAQKYNEAATALQKMLVKYPRGQFAANAHYWLGELYGLMNKNDQSATEFSTVVKRYPDSPKVADAQVKLGKIYAQESRWSEAKNAFKKVINKYPGTSSARLALEEIKLIKQSGH